MSFYDVIHQIYFEYFLEETIKQALTSCRWTMAYMGWICVAILYALRVNLGLAMICMVKYPKPVFSNASSSSKEVVAQVSSCGSESVRWLNASQISNQEVRTAVIFSL